jgi:hypothetical protein
MSEPAINRDRDPAEPVAVIVIVIPAALGFRELG